MLDSQKLFVLLLERLDRDDSLTPRYIGQFTCRDALPAKHRYPPVYLWIDGDGGIHADCDRAALGRVCVNESIRTGDPVSIGDPIVTETIARFVAMAQQTFAASMRSMAGLLRDRRWARLSARERCDERWAVNAR